MATSKSTVLGIRLDHDRRAWLEAAAAEEGVTVRALFERMIDQARAGETPSDSVPDSPAASTVGGGPIDQAAEVVAGPGVNTVPVQEVDAPPAQPTRSSAPVARHAVPLRRPGAAGRNSG